MSFNVITHPTSGIQYSIFSNPGRNLLKNYLRTYKSGGALTTNLESTTWQPNQLSDEERDERAKYETEVKACRELTNSEDDTKINYCLQMIADPPEDLIKKNILKNT